jgi:DNA-directed RNA polymerase subunit N
LEFPVRCFTCGAVIGDLYEDYKKLTKEKGDAGMALDSMGVERFCCRRMFVSHVEMMNVISKYPRR